MTVKPVAMITMAFLAFSQYRLDVPSMQTTSFRSDGLLPHVWQVDSVMSPKDGRDVGGDFTTFPGLSGGGRDVSPLVIISSKKKGGTSASK